MRKSAKKKSAAKGEPVSLLDLNVCAPDELNILDSMRNEAEIVAWWGRVKVYAKAMHALNRVVMLHPLIGENIWYVSSTPECVSAPATEEARDA